jgi:hypothetical protein
MFLLAQTWKTMVNAAKRRTSAGKVGRPPAGDGGERVKDYPQVSFRLPESARATLIALSKVRKQPQWRLIVDSVECYLRVLPRHERQQIARLVSARRSRDSE